MKAHNFVFTLRSLVGKCSLLYMLIAYMCELKEVVNSAYAESCGYFRTHAAHLSGIWQAPQGG